MSRSVGTAVIVSAFIPVLVIWVFKPLGLEPAAGAMSLVYALWTLLALSITFAKPSHYALTGYTRDNAIRVLERMPDLSACDKERFPALQSSLQRAEEDTKARLTTIKWFAGAALGFAVLLAQKGLDLSEGTMLVYAMISLIIATLVGGFISIHARANVAVYGLAHAVIHELEARPSTSPHRRLRRLAK